MKAKKYILLVFLLSSLIVSGCINNTDNKNIDNKNTDNKTNLNISQISKNSSNNLGVFYYMWAGGNPEKSPSNTWLHWKDGHNNPPKTWASNYLPDYSNGFDPYNDLYSSNDVNIINKQLSLMNRAGVNFVIASWWGQNHLSNTVLDTIFNKVLPENDYNLKFCIYYEKEGFADVPKSEIINDINYIKNKYASSNNYFKINGKPVIFVYNTKSGLFNESAIEEAQKWKEVRDETGTYVVLKTFGGYQKVANLADSWHEYAPATDFKQVGNYSAYISPGFYKWNEQPRLAREDFNRFENDVSRLASADVQFRLVETWNEWGEGTGIEPAMKINRDVNVFTQAEPSYGTKYIDILAKYFTQ